MRAHGDPDGSLTGTAADVAVADAKEALLGSLKDGAIRAVISSVCGSFRVTYNSPYRTEALLSASRV